MSLHEWLNLLLRWTHVIAAIAWIGSSFYFIWLDSHLERVPDGASGSAGGGGAGASGAGDRDLEGSLWMVHSGGFYRVERRRVGPGRMPATLHWFKWEAMITWLSGIALLIVVYYTTHGLYLVDPSHAGVSPAAARWIAIGALFAGWWIYDTLWRSAEGKFDGLATAISLVLLAVAAYGLTQVLSGRAAFVHVGALLGTIMVNNVWMRILPGQKRMIAAVERGEEPDLANSRQAKRRSVHNSYLTFPVLILMMSHHYPGVIGGAWNWVVMLALIVFGMAARHLMIGEGPSKRWAVAPLLASFVVAAWLAPSNALVGRRARGADVAAGPVPTFAQVQAVVLARCTACHSSQPRIASFGAAPGGVNFDDPAQIRRWRERIRVRAVDTQTMPLGNMTNMTEDERTLLGRWVAHGARTDSTP
jgi:uncharacterized membrane protein